MFDARYIIPLAVFALWICWYCMVLYPATRRARRFGPRWLYWFQSIVARWIGECLCGASFKCNAEEAYHSSDTETDTGTDDEDVDKVRLDTQLRQQSLITFHPHGAYMMTGSLFGGSVFYPRSNTDHKTFACVANLLFRVPFLSEFLLVNDARSVDKDVICALLNDGHSVAIQPGGIYEQVRFDANREVAYFAPNLGFIRLAIRFGIPLLPVYIFGENQLYRQNCLTRAVNKFLYKNVGIGTLCVIGRCSLPWLCFRPTNLYWHFGKPVEVGSPVPDPSEKEVRDVFRRYVAELQDIFETYCESYLPAEVASQGLTIVWRDHEDELIEV